MYCMAVRKTGIAKVTDVDKRVMGDIVLVFSDNNLNDA